MPDFKGLGLGKLDPQAAALERVLRELVPDEDWIDPVTFKVGERWIVPIDKPTLIYERAFGFDNSRLLCTCTDCVALRLHWEMYGITRSRGLHINLKDSPASRIARAIALKLGLEADERRLDRIACG